MRPKRIPQISGRQFSSKQRDLYAKKNDGGYTFA